MNYETNLVLDCANGVGALPMLLVSTRIQSYINIEMINTTTDDPHSLNEGCGAEFVHKESKLPDNYASGCPLKGACFDGDADRLIYFKRKDVNVAGPRFAASVIDGDKQFCLLMLYVEDLLKELGLS